MTSFNQEQRNQSRTPLTCLLAAAAALLFMVAAIAACSNSEDEQENSDSGSSTSEENESSDSSNPATAEGESSDSSNPATEENETTGTETSEENNTLVGLSYCETVAQWQEAFEDSSPDDPSLLEFVTAVATAAPADIAPEWETYRDAVAAFIDDGPLPAGVDLDALRAQLRNHAEATCDLVFSSAPTAEVDVAGCWARAIWLIGWGVDQDILNDPTQYQQTLNTALATNNATILFPVIEELYGLLGIPPASGTGPGYGSCLPFD